MSSSSANVSTPGASFATDHFSAATAQYRTFRPSYPDQLFQYFQSLIKKEGNKTKKIIAIDAGTGNGQAAVSLAKYVDRVYAFDPSKSLIDQAIPAEGVHYFVAGAENFLEPLQSLHSSIESTTTSTSPFPSSLLNNVSLIISATAAHWFDLPSFYSSVHSLLRPQEGILAIFSYGTHSISSNIEAEKISKRYSEALIPYWPQQIYYITNHYRDIPFPMDYESSFLSKYSSPPVFFIETDMTADELIGYLYTWSATRRFLNGNDNDNDNEKNTNNLLWTDIKKQLKQVWEKGEKGEEGMGKEKIILPIHLRIGLKGENDDGNKLSGKLKL